MGKGTPGAWSQLYWKRWHMFQNSGEPTQAALSKVSWYGCWNTGTYCMAKVYIIHLVPWSSINFSKVRNRWHCITDITFPPPLLSCKQENKTNTIQDLHIQFPTLSRCLTHASYTDFVAPENSTVWKGSLQLADQGSFLDIFISG